MPSTPVDKTWSVGSDPAAVRGDPRRPRGEDAGLVVRTGWRGHGSTRIAAGAPGLGKNRVVPGQRTRAGFSPAPRPSASMHDGGGPVAVAGREALTSDSCPGAQPPLRRVSSSNSGKSAEQQRRSCRPPPGGSGRAVPRARRGPVVEEARSEAYVSAQQPASRQAPRVPSPHVHPRRARRAPVSPGQGSGPPVGLIWRIRDRDTFLALRRDGVRARSGPLTLVHLADRSDEPTPPRVAFAIGRRVGKAVVRNQLRRRLRAVFAEDAAAGSVPPGAYLVLAQPAAAALSYPELRDHVRRALSRLEQRDRRS